MKNKLVFKLLLLALIALVAIAFYAFDLKQYLTLDYLQSQRSTLTNYYHQHRLATIAGFALIYIITTGLSLPGATILTLAGGATFGLWIGVVVISFASTLGATLAMLVARFLLRDYVQEKFKDKLSSINRGIEKEGAFYLFSLRLIPLFPFFVINLVMGLTPIRVWQYYLVSQLGMLPATFVYVNAGSQLGGIQSASGILSPELLLSFALLGIFPFIAKKMLAMFASRRQRKSYQKPRRYDYNMIVIGGGSAGLVSAYIASAVKAKVALIEKHKMGGDCLNTGCVPSKALIRSAKMLSYAARAKEFGFDTTQVTFDFANVMARVHAVIGKVAPHDSIERYSELGVDCFTGEAKILTPYSVSVNGKTYTTKNIVIATGAKPFVPEIPGLDKVPYYTSDTIWEIREQPKRMLVLGGGPIGAELAQAFQRLGSHVTMVDRGLSIMSREDADVSAMVMQRFAQEGIDLRFRHQARRFEHDGQQHVLVCEHEAGEARIPFDAILIALGRRPNVEGFGLEELGVTLRNNSTVSADDFMRTNYPNIYTCGDVTGPYQFTHTAAHQAWYVAVNGLFSPFKKFRVDYSVIPWATYTDPEVARVGLNEKEAKQKNIPYELVSYGIDDLDRAIADSEDHGVVKVLTVPGKDKILGVTIVGAHAGDLIAEFVFAMKHGLGLNKILGTIHIYPTLAEANKYAAGAWKKAHKPEGLLRWVERYHAWRRGG